MDKNTRNSWNNLNQMFKNIVELPEFKSRMGAIKQGKNQVERKAAAPEKKPAEVKAKK